MSARELCKIGLVFLNEGKWKDNQIISSEWVRESHKERITFTSNHPYLDSYGYQWWRNTFEVAQMDFYAYLGLGWGEQVLLIFPEENMIIQFYSGYFQSDPAIYPTDLVEEFILPDLTTH